MKKLLLSLAAVASAVSVPAAAAHDDHRNHRQWEQHQNRSGVEFNIRLGDVFGKRHDNRYEHRNQRYNQMCPGNRDYLSVHGLRTHQGQLIIGHRAYPVRTAQCVFNIREGQRVVHDINYNGRADYWEPQGRVREDYRGGRNGWNDNFYTVDFYR